jgi:hypothetical protein
MKARCANKNHIAYHNYGGRGITVCDRWLKFENFVTDMWLEYKRRVENGEKISIDRYLDVNGNYELSNCKWSTDSEQGKTRRNSSKTENYDSHDYWHEHLGSTISKAIVNTKGIYKPRKGTIVEFYVGIPVQELRQYIQSLWEPWMTWDNYGRGEGKWSIDHIKQCREFDLSKEEDRKACFNYKNLRPYNDVTNNKEQNRQPAII